LSVDPPTNTDETPAGNSPQSLASTPVLDSARPVLYSDPPLLLFLELQLSLLGILFLLILEQAFSTLL
jgi:hypothetical protein